MKWSKLALQNKNDFHTNSQLGHKSCYPIVSLIVYRRAIKQLIPLKEENSRLSKTMKTLQVIWRTSKWPSMTVKWPSKSNSNFRWFDTVWLVRKWRILEDAWSNKNHIWSNSKTFLKDLEGFPAKEIRNGLIPKSNKIFIRQKDETDRRISLLDQVIWQVTSETIIVWSFWRPLKVSEAIQSTWRPAEGLKVAWRPVSMIDFNVYDSIITYHYFLKIFFS